MSLDLNATEIGEIVRALRKHKSVSQDQLAQVLDIPRSSVSQIESGGRELSFVEFQKILGLFEVSFDEFVSYGKAPKVVTPVKGKSVNKKIKFDSEKFKQLFLYILEKCGGKPNVGETVLYKLLYFCDFNYFEIYEKPLTGMKYKKMQYGPIPDQTLFNPIIKEMQVTGMAERVSRSYLNDTIQTRYLNFATADLSVFGSDTDKMIKVVDSVIERLSGMSARQIEDHSHHDHPWQAHEYGEEIDYSSVFFRSGEFANRDYDAMWEQASGSDILKELGEMPADEYDYYLKLLNNGGL
ncbi:MAG: type II toxin-antitoxin system antitoxin SocA domain-containing protein [Candidatus Gracilibacteria bacterium]